MPPLDHETFLRRAFALAQRARSHGNHPFGAILVSGTGEILLEAENGYMPDRDMTGHAERLLATAASKQFDPKFLADCTLYTSAEPCCMCAGAAYWAGIGRGLWLVRAAAENDHWKSCREPDARSALPHRVRRRAAEGPGHRAIVGRRGRRRSRGGLGLAEHGGGRCPSKPLTRQRLPMIMRCPLPQGERARSDAPCCRHASGTTQAGRAMPSPLVGEGGSAFPQTGWVRG